MMLLFVAQFDSLPSNSSVPEGGEAAFNCTATGSQPVAWSLRRGTTPLGNIITSNRSDINGLDQALLLGSLGSPLFLRGTNRILDGISVVCVTLVGGVLQVQNEPFAVLTVLCELLYSLQNLALVR